MLYNLEEVVTLPVSTENLQKLVVNVKLCRLVNVDYSLTDMLANCDRTLFKAVKWCKQCLNHLFTVNTKNVHIIASMWTLLNSPAT